MYVCDNCKQVSAARARANRVVTEIRPKSYAPQSRPMRGRSGGGGGRGRGRGRQPAYRESPGGSGWEAVSVSTVCGECLPEAEARFQALLEALTPATVTPEVTMGDAVADINIPS